jgi:putative ABC transport system permease protein
MKDVRYAIRLFLRQPLFSTVVVATLALGIGGVATMFSVVNAVLLRPLPYDDPDELVWMYGAFRLNDSASVSPPDFIDYRERNDVFETLGAMMNGPSGVTATGAEGPDRLQATFVSAGLITALGVPPVLGRDLQRPEESLAGPQAVVISHRVWQDVFGGADDVLGRTLTVDARPRAVVGVMPAGFRLPYDEATLASRPIDLYLPLPLDAPETQVRRFHFLRLVGRLAPGVSLAQAQERLDVIARDLEATYPENETWRLRLLPLHEQVVGDVRQAILTFFAAVGLVLLIACANVASLLLARATSRQNEIAVRTALGASRSRVVRQLFVESLALALAGAAAGLVLAGWGIELLKQVGPANLPRLSTVTMDPVVMGAALMTAIGATVIFGLAPALQAARPAATSALGDGTRAGHSRSRVRLRQALVVLQVALSVMLLIGAGLLTRSLVRLQAVDFGFGTRGVLLASISLPPESYEGDEDVEPFFTTLSEKLNALPGVDAAALATSPPLVGGNDTSIHRPESPPATSADRQHTQIRWVQGRYFEALDIPLLSGRLLDDRRDGPDAPPAIVISRMLAENFFPDENPIGQRLTVDLRTPVTAEIVGVVADARVFGQVNGAPPLLYMSSRQSPTNFMNVIASTTMDPAALAGALRAAVRELDPTIAVDRIRRMHDLADASVASPRFRAGLIGSFAGVALLLTLVGLHGLLAYAVSQRRREIGIRLALGARADQVVGLVVRQGAALVAVGAILGLAGAMAANRLFSAMLFDVSTTDPLVFGLVTGGLIGVAVLAFVVPARRAARVDPVSALRSE